MSVKDWKMFEDSRGYFTIRRVLGWSLVLVAVLAGVAAVIFGIDGVWFSDPRAGGVAGILFLTAFVSAIAGAFTTYND